MRDFGAVLILVGDVVVTVALMILLQLEIRLGL